MTTKQMILSSLVLCLVILPTIAIVLVIAHWYSRAGLFMLLILGYISIVIIGQWLKFKYWGKHEKPDNS